MASVAPQISRWLSVFALLWGLAVANKCDGCVTQYDGLQRPGTITDAAGGVTSHVYGLNSGGNAFDSSGFKPTMVVDVDGYTTLVTNDALYRTTQTAVGYATGLWSATNTAYDAVGNAVQVTDPLGNVTTTGYDALNRVVSKTFADGTTNSLGYTSTGLKWRAVDELGQVTTIVYDGAGRATKVQAPPLSDGTQAVTQTVYDAAGNAVATINALGYRTDVTYDAVNRLLTTTDGAGITVTYQYDLVGNRTAVIDGKENTTAFQYDGLKRNTQSTDALGQATVLGYDALNKVSRTDASGQATAYGYDQRNRLLTTNYGAGAPENRTYVYDPAGRLLSVSEPGQGGLADVAYGYDAMNRVVSETAGGVRYYDPRLGRWLSRDPMGEAGGFNLYAYCGNDPVNRWDYLGMLDPIRDANWGVAWGPNGLQNPFPNATASSNFTFGVGAALGGGYQDLAADIEFRWGMMTRNRSMLERAEYERTLLTRTARGLEADPYSRTSGLTQLGVLAAPLALKGAGLGLEALEPHIRAGALSLRMLTSELGPARPSAPPIEMRESSISALKSEMALAGAAETAQIGVRDRVLANIADSQAARASSDFRYWSQTVELRSLTTEAAQQVDALGMAAFSPRQQAAILRYPRLQSAYRGSAVDSLVRQSASQDNFLRQLTGSPNRGPDFLDPYASGVWWDITTPAQWPAHVSKYGLGGTLLPTR